jgi:proteic killer suppression protein
MITSFKDKKTAALFAGSFVREFVNIQRQAERKLLMLDSATALVDLRSPPANMLEALKGDRQGQYSIRINRQWRVCFVWDGHHAFDVEIVDYH